MMIRKEGEEMDGKITLKAARVNAGLTQEEAARLVGVSKATIINYEKGVSFPRAETISKFEQIYKMKYDDIFFG